MELKLLINSLQPSQLYISQGKLSNIQQWFNPMDLSNFDPIPIKQHNGMYVITDGHTRVTAAILAGLDTVPIVWDNDDLDMEAYGICINWCLEEGVNSPQDLVDRIIPQQQYELLWNKRCEDNL